MAWINIGNDGSGGYANTQHIAYARWRYAGKVDRGVTVNCASARLRDVYEVSVCMVSGEELIVMSCDTRSEAEAALETLMATIRGEGK